MSVKDSPGLLHVPLGGGAVRQAGQGDLQVLPLGLDVAPRDLDPFFQGLYRDVVRRRVAGKAHQGVVIVRNGRLQGRVGRFYRTPEPSPEVDLPARGDADLVLRIRAEAAGERGKG